MGNKNLVNRLNFFLIFSLLLSFCKSKPFDFFDLFGDDDEDKPHGGEVGPGPKGIIDKIDAIKEEKLHSLIEPPPPPLPPPRVHYRGPPPPGYIEGPPPPGYIIEGPPLPPGYIIEGPPPPGYPPGPPPPGYHHGPPPPPGYHHGPPPPPARYVPGPSPPGCNHGPPPPPPPPLVYKYPPHYGPNKGPPNGYPI